MNLQDLRDLSRAYKKTTETNDPDAKLDKEINRANRKIHELIKEAEGKPNDSGQIKFTDLVSSTDLIEGQAGYNGEYAKPFDCVINEVHLDYGNGYQKAEIVEMDSFDTSIFEEDTTSSQDNPKVFMFRDSYFVRPLNNAETITKGIKLIVSGEPADLVKTTDRPTWYSAFHELIALYVALEYYRIYSEKYNPRVASDALTLESQLISKIEDEKKAEMRFQAIKEQF